MESYLIYIGKSALAAGAFYLVYLLLFQNQKQFVFNRIYLPVSLALSFIIPLITFTKTRFIEALPASSFDSSEFLTYIPEATQEIQFTFQWFHYLTGIYLLGIAGFLFHLLLGHVKALSIVRYSRIKELFKTNVNITQKDVHPFSFFHKIVLSEKTLKNPNLEIIVSHENIHVKEKHTLDILFAEILFLFQWFNPFAWLIKYAIKDNLEYKTDHQITKTWNQKDYQLAMVGLADKQEIAPFLTALNGSQLKNRIIMMKKKTENKYAFLKQLLVLPLLGILIMSLANREIKTEIVQPEEVAESIPITKQSLKIFNKDFSSELYHDGLFTLQDYGSEAPLLFLNREKVVEKVVFDETDFRIAQVIKSKEAIERFGDKGKNGAMLFETKSSIANEITVKGKVTNEKEEPVPGTSVIIKGKATGTITNSTGEYEIKLEDKNETLIFSKANYLYRQVQVKGREKIDVLLFVNKKTGKKEKEVATNSKEQEADNDNRIIIKGDSGDIEIENPVYIVDGIETDNIEVLNPNNIESVSVLKGKSAILHYGEKGKNGAVIIETKAAAAKTKSSKAKESATIRGLSADINNPPLYIIDGIEVEDIDIIKPDAIESISVLKDASAKAIYGNKGKNGVILLTTKAAAGAKAIGNPQLFNTLGSNKTVVRGYPTKLKAENTAANDIISDSKGNPLYIVDGKEHKGDINHISPNSISSINVLKTEAAVKLYGEKAKYGAVEITLKDTEWKEPIYFLDGESIARSEAYKYMGSRQIVKDIITLKKDEAVTKYGDKATNGAVEIYTKETPSTVDVLFNYESNGSKPLLILNGEETNASINQIDPAYITSVNVLKGELAKSKYGDKGKNGVIEVTWDIKITTQLELRKFIAKNIKYPTEAQESGGEGTVSLYLKMGKTIERIKVPSNKKNRNLKLDEVVVAAYKPEKMSSKNFELANKLLLEEVSRVVDLIPSVEIPEFKDKPVGISVKFKLLDDIMNDNNMQNSEKEIVIPEGFSPNGDGVHDYFEVTGLEKLYPNFKMKILNNNKLPVWEYKHNGDPNSKPKWWNGKDNKNNVEKGTYYYVIEYNSDSRKENTAGTFILAE